MSVAVVRHPRVFLGLTEVAGYYRNLESGFRELGVDARFFDLSENPLRYGARSESRSVVVAPAPSIRRRIARGLRRRLIDRPWRFAKTLALMAWAIPRYDVFIFYGQDSFLMYRDLPILKALGKKVIYVFNGSDHRPPYLNGKSVRQAHRYGDAWLARETKRIKGRVALVERHADAVVALSASAQFHARPFLHFLAIGLPIPGAPPAAGWSTSEDAPIRILHSPTDRVSKGSDHIRDAVARLKEDGYNVEFVELTERPNAEVLSEIGRSSFVVDQMYSDTPMAGFGAEAAWQGRAAVVTGLYAAHVHDDVPAALIPPTFFGLPEEMARLIADAVKEPERHRVMGSLAHTFVVERWRAADVAARFLAVIEGNAPAEWWCEPTGLRYYGGWGMPAAMVREGIRTVLADGGPAALQMDHNPRLRDEILEFAS